MMVAVILIIGTGITGLPIEVFLFAVDLSSQGSPFEACEPHL
jgi:hypothetical protein